MAGIDPEEPAIGVIGGSGLYRIEGLEAQVAGLVEELDTSTDSGSKKQELMELLKGQAVDLAGEKGALLEVEASMVTSTSLGTSAMTASSCRWRCWR